MNNAKIVRHFRSIKMAFRISLGIIVCLTFAMMVACGKKKPEALPPPVVEVVEVLQKDVPIYAEYVGTADGFVNATIRAQVQGYLIKQNYREGDFVKKGQILFEIDPRTFEAALDQAKGQLAAYQARWDTAQANLKRIKPLAAQNAVSQKDLDDATGTEQAARAAVIAAQAAVDKATVDLGFTKVTSLIDGIAGIAKAQIGNLVGPGATEELTTVSTVDPIKVYVQISEQEYFKGMEKQKDKRRPSSLELILADGSTYPHKGEIAFADRQINVQTGTIKVATLFSNPNNLLRPGQFAKIRAMIEMKKGALLVPQRAVSDVQGRNMVAVVGPENKIDIRTVKVGEQIGPDRIISEGLNAGEKIVAEGIQKVKAGTVVNPQPFNPEKAKDAASKPAASSEGAPPKPEAKPAAPAPSEKR